MSQHDPTSTALRLPVQAQDHEPACDHDHAHDHGHDHGPDAHTHAHAAADACCAPTTQTDCLTGVCNTNPAPEGTSRVRYRIDKMDCPTEERLIRNKLEAMPGVVQLDFNLVNRELTVYHRLDQPQEIAVALDKLGMAPNLLEANAPVSVLPPALSRRQKGLLAVAGAAAVAAEVIAWSSGQEASWMVMALAAVSILSAGLPTLKKGWIALRNLTLNINFLMSIAVAGAVALGKWPEAAMVVFLFAVAEAIEALSLERARNAIKALTAIAPETAEVKAGEAWE
ncbi:cation transporter, partial [Thiomonas arsenitoxydans]